MLVSSSFWPTYFLACTRSSSSAWDGLATGSAAPTTPPPHKTQPTRVPCHVSCETAVNDTSVSAIS